MNTIFWTCVKIMEIISNILGITYQELNVILFVIMHPTITIIFARLYIKYKKLYNKTKTQK